MDFSFDSIAIVPELQARAIFHSDSTKVFREDENLNPIIVDDHYGVIGGDSKKITLFLHFFRDTDKF